MSIGDGIYQSVRLFCVTLFLIALLQLALPLSRLWFAYSLIKSPAAAVPERDPLIEAPTFHIDPRLRDGDLARAEKL